MGWRKHDFKQGARYRVRKPFVSVFATFTEGDLLIFENDTYSYYDNSTVFEFRNATTGESQSWWLHDDEPAESWRDYFEEVQPSCRIC